MYEVISQFVPSRDDQIGLEVGQVIAKSKEIGNGWSIGYNQSTGKTGCYPTSYVVDIPKRKTRFSNFQIKSGRKKPDILRPSERGYNMKPLNKGEDTVMLPSNLNKSTDKEINKAESNPNTPEWKTLNIRALASALFFSASEEHKLLKRIVGAFCGLVSGSLLYLVLVYSYGFQLPVAGIVTGIATLTMCLTFAFSRRGRCTGLLMLPSLTTGRGRAALLSVITALLLRGPVMTITHNANEVSTSLACSTELAYNQSRELQQVLQEPLKGIRDQILESGRELIDANRAIQNALGKITGGIDKVEGAIRPAKQVLENAVSACQGRLNTASKSCERKINKLKAGCKSKLSLPGSSGVTGGIRDAFSGIGRRRRATRFQLIPERPVLRRPRHRRGVSDVCDTFNADDLCAPVRATGDFCQVPKVADTAISGAVKSARASLSRITGQFDFGFSADSPIKSDANSSKTAAEITNAVKEEIRQKTETVEYVAGIVSRLLAVLLLSLVAQSMLYLRSYLAKDKFDNLYISKKFLQLDTKRKEDGEKSVLPLLKKEKTKYIHTSSWRLLPLEKVKLIAGTSSFLFHFLITGTICFLDYVLYWVLTIVRNNGQVDLTFTGDAQVVWRVTGNGILAQFIRLFVDGIAEELQYNSTISTTACLPDPVSTPPSTLYQLGALYVVAFVLLLLQAYGQRLRHLIAGYAYPERDEERIVYLYETILRKRAIRKADKERLDEEKQKEMVRKEKFKLFPKIGKQQRVA